MIKCPECSTQLQIKLSGTVNSSLSCKLKQGHDLENIIRHSLFRYWRWKTEGKPIYGNDQYWYDNYHDCIRHVGGEMYSYHIQTSDSPEGDTWLSGTFKVDSCMGIKILEKNCGDI